MKPILPTIVLSVCTLFSNLPLGNASAESIITNTKSVNTKYSEFPSAMFKNKLVVTSSKKIGGLGNGVDENTNQPYSQLFCLDVDDLGDLSKPMFFSRALNTKGNEGHLSFSPDEKTVYFTRSSRDNSKNYQLYKANLNLSSNSYWVNITKLTKNTVYSIENPHVSPDGKKLYFSSNLPGSLGGYDLYVSNIEADGSLSTPENLGPQINTENDEKFPHLSKDGKQLFFSSNGHDGFGGFDVFVSNMINEVYELPENLGEAINSSSDDVSFMLANENGQGYLASNREGGKGNFDIYSLQLDSQFKVEEIFASRDGKK